MLGTLKGELGGSEYLKVIHNLVAGDAPAIDLPFEKRVHNACLESIRNGIINSAIDISDGGLAVALAEACIGNPEKPLGASVYISRKQRDDEIFFGESQSVIILSISEHSLLKMEQIAAKNIVPCFTIGRVKDNRRLKLNESVDLSLDDIKSAYENTIPEIMKLAL
jgi:phosphoribosylformylglycinamidine synthase